MEPQNKVFEDHFSKTILELDRYEASLISNIEVTKQQLASMEQELENLIKTKMLQKGGKTAIEFCTANNIALIQVTTLQPQEQQIQQPEQPQQPTQPMPQGVPQAPPQPVQPQAAAAPSQQQYAQQPTQQSFAPAPPITKQAQQTFAPPSYPSQGDIQAAQAIQGPQIVQGNPPPVE